MIRIALPLLVVSLSACASIEPTAPSAPSDTVVEAAREHHAGHDPRLRASPAPIPASPVAVPLDPAMLAALPRESVTATAHERTLHCEGIPLLALLRASGAMPAEPLRSPQLTRYVLVAARDGYRTLYALAELDPTLGNRKVFLVDRCDGQPLADEDGPLRLISPDEARSARWVRQVAAITVIVAP